MDLPFSQSPIPGLPSEVFGPHAAGAMLHHPCGRRWRCQPQAARRGRRGKSLGAQSYSPIGIIGMGEIE